MRTLRRVTLEVLRATSLLLGLGLALLPAESYGDHLERDYRGDSEIVLSETFEGGSNRVTITTRDGATTLTSEQGGKTTQRQVPQDAAAELWDHLLALPIDELESATPSPAMPDASSFELSLRVGATSHRLITYDVDRLEDQRYRDAIRAILSLERRLAEAVR